MSQAETTGEAESVDAEEEQAKASWLMLVLVAAFLLAITLNGIAVLLVVLNPPEPPQVITIERADGSKIHIPGDD